MDGLVNAFCRLNKKMKTARTNRKLCRRFPFLIPWNRFTGEYVYPYDHSFTELDCMPDGWRKAFGIQMCEEIRDALIEDGDLYRWRIVQIKEKYGSLRFYYNGCRAGSRIPEIVSKYEKLSERTCIVCGNPATRITMGWVSPYCDRCCPEETFLAIDEYDMEDDKNGR